MHENYKQLIEKLLPDNTEREAFFSCYRELLPRSIKIIEHTISSETFRDVTHAEWRSLQSPWFVAANDSWYIKRDDESVALGKHRLHTAWFFYIQEVAASLAVDSLELAWWEFVLDMCAAPWWKSTQIADKLLTIDPTSPWLVVSNEISWSRIIALQSNLNRTWSYNTAITQLDGAQFGNLLPDFFDKVLVDAPCSWEGRWFKSDASTKWRREENVQKIARLQSSLLTSAIKTCKPWGSIVYATCTLNPWENEWVIAQALREHEWVITLEDVAIAHKSIWLDMRDGEPLLRKEDAQKVARFWPHRQHTWGFFIAKIRKNKAAYFTHAATRKEVKPQKKSALNRSENLQKQISDLLFADYGIVIDPLKYRFASTSNQIYMISPAYDAIHEALYVEKVGVPILKRHSKTELRPLHWLGTMLGYLATKNVIQLTDKECQKYSDWRDLDTDATVTTPHKYAVLRWNEFGFSVGKVVWNTIKNKFQK